jgi:hypothetical protein
MHVQYQNGPHLHTTLPRSTMSTPPAISSLHLYVIVCMCCMSDPASHHVDDFRCMNASKIRRVDGAVIVSDSQADEVTLVTLKHLE